MTNAETNKTESYTPGPNAVDISPNQDGGVKKEILTPGTGDDHPQKGNKVFVHYTGKLVDGTVFDSSRERGEFDFSLGEGQVIKAWDIGVASMKKGEICMLTCAPEYAYGKSGSPPKIPAEATLVFEVELLRWTLEDLSPKKDQGILRHVIKAGEGADTPNDEAMVEVHLVGKFGDKVFEEKDVKFELGEGADHGVVEGIEIALKHFKQGEMSRLTLSPKYAFGSTGKPDLDIPADSEIVYEVTLKSFEKAKESWSMDSDEKLVQSEIVKNKGTQHFKSGNFEKAIKQYKKIVSFLEYETGLEGEKQKQKDALLLAGHLNLAACYLKVDKPSKAIASSDNALKLEPDNAKGLFRRGQAHFMMNDFDLAKKDFLQLVKVDPSNKAAQKQILMCQEKMKLETEKEKKLYRNMFAKLSKSDETPNGKTPAPEKKEEVEPESTAA